MKNTEKRIEKISWAIVLTAFLYLTISTGIVAVEVWEMWFLTAILGFLAMAAFANLIKKETK